MNRVHELSQISENIFAPIAWLDTLIPKELKLLPSAYKLYPYDFFKTAYNTQPLYDLVCQEKDRADTIGIISTDKGIVTPKEQTAIRNTYNLLPNERFMQLYRRIFAAHRKRIETFFNLSIVSSGDPQILIYTPGCFYIRHSDNCTELLENGELIGFKPVAGHRTVTTVLFLNDDFKGGELSFDFFYDDKGRVITLDPKAGHMISFLSNPYYSHSVHPVTEGTRISVAQWHTAIAH